MAQIGNQPLLSLCIPIYNRKIYLEKQLKRFLDEKELFEQDIALYISDNCSTDDLYSCCEEYQQRGLNLEYHRNEMNLGPDGNFENCFRQAKGKYVWLLGSDDVPCSGVLSKIVQYLKQGDYGLVHLSMRERKKELTIYDNPDAMAISVNYWITFMSANIIRTNSLRTVNLSDYRTSFMIQVPAYLNACCFYQRNAIIYCPIFFEKETDSANNGGYNVFEVFVTNLYGIYESFVQKGLLSQETFKTMIKVEYREFLLSIIIHQVILHQKRNFTTDGVRKRLVKYYGNKPYAYYYLVKGLFDVGIQKLSKSIRGHRGS